MENFHNRGPQCTNFPYLQEMNNYPQLIPQRNSKENLVHEDTMRLPPRRHAHVKEEIVTDQAYSSKETYNTEDQLLLSQHIYELEIKLAKMSAENREITYRMELMKEENTDLTSKLNTQAISGLQNYEEEKRKMMTERDDLEVKVNMCNGIIRGLDEEKRHKGEKISMLETQLKSYTQHPPPQPHFPYQNDYAYSSRDAMNSGYYTKSNLEMAPYSTTSSGYFTTPFVYDPGLTCDFCGSKFLHGEIQKLREHLNTIHPI